MQRLVILDEAEALLGLTSQEGLATSEHPMGAFDLSADITAIRSGSYLRIIRNRSGSCGVVRINAELKSVLDGTWQGCTRIEQSHPPLPYSFETFVAWKGNKLALEFAKSLASSQRGSYGVLAKVSLCGGSGSGKTHLLSSIWMAVKRRDPSAKVAYLTASRLFEHLISAMHTDRVPELEEELGELDVLLIDQGEDLVGMERAQEIVKNALDATSEHGTAVVFTWNEEAPPNRRLRLNSLQDRLSGFLPIRLEPHEGEKGRALLKALLGRYTRHAPIPDRWAEWLISRSRGRVRTLQGLVARLQFECRINHLDLGAGVLPDIAAFEESLRGFLESSLKEEFGDLDRP